MARTPSRSQFVPKHLAIIGGVAALVVGVVAGRVTAPKPGDAGPELVGPAGDGSMGGGTYTEKKVELEASPYKGPEDAPVVIYEISEFQCPFCSRVGPTIDQIAQTWPNDVRIVFKHNPLSFHKEARLAAIASMAAARQGHFWKYHDTLFANQKALKKDDLIKYATDLGMDIEQFKKDLDDPKLAQKVDSDQAAAVAVGATGTPAFFVNGVNLSGAKPFEEFKAEIEKQLEKAKALEAQGVERKAIARRLTAQNGASQVLKYIVDEVPAPKVEQKAAAAPGDDTKTVWKVPVDVDKDGLKGPKHALVTIVEFSEFQCPFCAKVLPTLEQIEEAYGDKVRVVFKHNPLSFHPDAPLAAQAALAARAQGKFWEMHDLLFQDTQKLKRPDLEAYAEELGLDMAAFNKALDEGTYKDQVAADQAIAEGVQAQGTPNFFVNGRKLTGAKPFEDFKEVIDEEIAKSEKLVAGGTSMEALYDRIIKNGKIFNPLDDKVVAIDTKGAASLGKENARITIVEYSDFECPFCSRVGDPLKQLMKKYPDDVRIVFKHFPLNFHKKAQKASEASLAANAQGRFWDMHDIMFQNQKALDVDKLHLYAEQLGLDLAKFKAELDGNKYADQVKADIAEGNRIGVRGTPSVFINGRKYSPSGGYTVESLEKLLAKEFGLSASAK